MKISIAICTWNRAELLAQTLRSMTEMATSLDGQWELLVVNNNCTDDTDRVLDNYADCLPLRRLHEPQQGHSHSRNCAVQAARGEYLIWTDDDVLVDANWLAAYEAAFQQHNNASFWGGPIEPRFECPPPPWLDHNWQRCQGIYAVRLLGEETLQFDRSTLPFGANFAIRTELQRKYMYDSRFGRVTDQVVRGFDEIDVLGRILDDGGCGYWVPHAKLSHFIPADRMTLQYVRKYYRGQGQTWIVRGHTQPTRASLVRRWLGHQVAYLWNRMRRRDERWFPHLVEASRVAGQLSHL